MQICLEMTLIVKYNVRSLWKVFLVAYQITAKIERWLNYERNGTLKRYSRANSDSSKLNDVIFVRMNALFTTLGGLYQRWRNQEILMIPFKSTSPSGDRCTISNILDLKWNVFVHCDKIKQGVIYIITQVTVCTYNCL